MNPDFAIAGVTIEGSAIFMGAIPLGVDSCAPRAGRTHSPWYVFAPNSELQCR